MKSIAGSYGRRLAWESEIIMKLPGSRTTRLTRLFSRGDRPHADDDVVSQRRVYYLNVRIRDETPCTRVGFTCKQNKQAIGSGQILGAENCLQNKEKVQRNFFDNVFK